MSGDDRPRYLTLKRQPRLLVDRGAIVGVGRETSGWVCVAPPVPESGRWPGEPLRLIALSGHVADDELASVLAHESAHLWLIAPPADVDPTTVAEHRAARRSAIQLAHQMGPRRPRRSQARRRRRR
jgi:hypothetical protein